MTNLKTQLEAAQRELTGLQEDLPRFHGLLTDNEQEAERLRREKADLDEQAQARGRVSVAREMLEQHQADISVAQGEVERLASEVAHETFLTGLAELAESATGRRKALEKALDDAHSVLERHVKRILIEWTALSQDRQAFTNQARGAPGFFGWTGVPGGVGDESMPEEERKAGELLGTLEARGIDLTAVLTPHDGNRLSMMDRYGEGVTPPTPYGQFVMGALVMELNRGQEAFRAELRMRNRERQEQPPVGLVAR